ncbi:bis(5'-nucleosyl)-tetraphosphatase (symmetrical) YqeK [Ruminiclostridium herbifermentans]|uniref:bis(5'-nucleosyl)-tetraphosphatase (symmetrical) n=1 Tax=Ruminiclostridium herbifermentans TaxID=2488810 RepID=A0A4V6ENF6_9FIRM|nr:bis(5'-nucleosyl)-tetraphosphatase (symmetrical) YqeK [Ruminiclostridium herbifermentans]QNU65868.1 bis(5'-nucleosyl)-tetraphosphatase (symmetrical) YqeK [Ruminiclostridium herbifermentans]
MNIIEMDALLKESLKPNRYVHSVNTMKAAIQLAEHYGEDKDIAAVAGLLHDCAKELNDIEILKYCNDNKIELNEIEKNQLFLMHGEVGAIIAKEKYSVENEIILNAIRYHTTGFSKMNMIDKIVYLADYIEPGRTHRSADDVRSLVYEDIDKALICAFNNVIKFVIMQNGLIHPFTIEARNTLLLKG